MPRRRSTGCDSDRPNSSKEVRVVNPIGMLDLKAEFPELEAEVRAAIDGVLASQAFIGGPQIAAFESRVAERLGCPHAIAVSSGTDAILMALMAAGIGPGDEVITTPFTFFATAGCVHRLGAKPVFVDIDPRCFNIDPEKIEPAITPRTKAILPVHLFGQCANMDAIGEIVKRHDLIVIEDAAQAIGATYRGTSAGTLGLAGCFSFYPTKNLGGFGEGGMVTTHDDAFAERCRQTRNHGQTETYYHAFVGGNFRMDTLKAAILDVKLARLDRANAARRENAARYDALLADLPEIETPQVNSDCHMVYHQYSILCDRREELRQALGDASIGSGIYYPVPLHRQPCFADLGYKEGDLPVSEACARRILALPIHPNLTADDVARVAGAIRAFHGAKAAPASAVEGARA
jgi:dTDP-4-amino-4,6-dideoxygalactose transaminase